MADAYDPVADVEAGFRYIKSRYGGAAAPVAEFVCMRCEAGQCARCSDRACTCCYGNEE